MVDEPGKRLDSIAWRHLEAGRFDEAAKLYRQAYQASGRTFLLHNAALAWLNLGRFDEARADLEEVVERTPVQMKSASDLCLLGASCWMLGATDKAVESWIASLAAPYADVGGGVAAAGTLFYAGVRLADLALIMTARLRLQKLMRRKGRGWPLPIGQHLLGKLYADDLLQEATASDVQKLQVRHLCQAHFYVGVRQLEQGNRLVFKAHIKQCAESPWGYLEHEYYLARWEVARDFTDIAH